MDFLKLLKKHEAEFDYADIRIEEGNSEVIKLENKNISLVDNSDFSYGIRVLVNGAWGLAYSNELKNAPEIFKKALKIAKASSRRLKEKVKIAKPKPHQGAYKIKFKENPFSIDTKEKINYLKDYKSALSAEDRIKNITSVMSVSRTKKQFISLESDIKQEFYICLLRFSATASENGLIEETHKMHCKLGGYEIIKEYDQIKTGENIKEAVIRLLHAKNPKGGKMPVVCDPQLTGVFFHEAVGHACEADHIISNSSIFKDMLGKRVASEEINMCDDPTANARGFYWFDDEGVKARETKLITNGVLTNYLHSIETAGKLGMSPTGNGRVESPIFKPIPRMSNTVLKPGKWSFYDLVKEAKNGIYAKGFAGGIVEPITGQFSFGAQECYLIENGEISKPLKEVTLAGNILEILKDIKVGSDMTNPFSAGTCGKGNQSVRVGDLAPHILLKEAIVGGRD